MVLRGCEHKKLCWHYIEYANKGQCVEVNRFNDIVMLIKLVVNAHVVNIL